MKNSTKQERFISSVIENLKTPTVAQIKALELFLSTSGKKINTEEKDLIELTLNSCNNMQKMIENFTLISKIDSEKINLDYKYFNLTNLINKITEDTDIVIKYSNLKLNITSEENIEIYADDLKIKKVIENLLSYTINSAYKNSKIEINLSQNKNTVKFEITSNGMSENHKEILQMFKQTQPYNPKYTELYIAKEIIKAHFGKIIFKTSEDTLTTGFCLPIK